ncbi:MAG: hypothetical protein QY332_13875 [Anaerolineales bacterium]|nr:MAG: hypothetical protein QY332_13875 [Anaerolineales bacterium]
MNRILFFLLVLIALSLACAYSPATPAMPAPSVSSGTVLFQDDFSRSSSGWTRMLNAEGVMDYDGGGYRILVNSQQMNFWSTPQKDFTDVRLEVDTGKLAGPDENRIGLICRFNGSDYYFFIISSDGFYGAGIFFSGQALLLGQSEMQSSESIHKGLAVNHLRADCIGNTLTFYVNGFQVAQFRNDVLASGDVGMLAGTFDTPGVDIIFDNFVVLQP